MRIKRLGIMLLAGLLAALQVSFAAADAGETDEAAENLTDRCGYYFDAPENTRNCQELRDDVVETKHTFRGGQKIGIVWTDGVPVDSVFIEFGNTPGAYRVLQYDGEGRLLSDKAGIRFVNHLIRVAARARSVVIVPTEETCICSLHAYGKGRVERWYPWNHSVKKLDYLVFAMHPDDDVLFLGAIVPIYGAEKGKEGRIAYCTQSSRYRVDEAQAGAWTMGMRNAPLFGTLRDMTAESRQKYPNTFTKEKVARFAVRLIREHKPEVVFSHDLKGEYGHWQHALLAASVLDAVSLAADASYDPESAKTFGVWRVKKLYLHLYPENRIELPVTAPLKAFGGKTAVDVAKAAYQFHSSQLASKHAVKNSGVYSLSAFGLAFSRVGADTPGKNDPFEHVPASVPYTHFPAFAPFYGREADDGRFRFRPLCR